MDVGDVGYQGDSRVEVYGNEHMSFYNNNNLLLTSMFGLITIGLLVVVFLYIPLIIYPAEDAAILFQYSENFANTGIISYNSYGERSEGATDFLWMIILSVLYFLGLSTYIASTILSMLALIGTAYLLFKISKLNNINYFFFLVLCLLLLPTTPASLLGFSPLFFGFFITLSVYFFLQGKLVNFLVAGLLLCLVRPDGIVITFPLIAFYLYFHYDSIQENLQKVIVYFILPGIAYFIWRWHYFGEFLPLPFYVKSNFDRFLYVFNKGSLDTNISFLKKIYPLIIFSCSHLLFIIFQKKRFDKSLALVFSIVIMPTVFYSSMTLSQNISYRFQYPIILGVILIATIFLKKTNRYIFLSVFVFQIISLLPLTIKEYAGAFTLPFENNTYISQGLHEITSEGKMVITEAGKLAYYSKWEAIDAWGLNTPKFSKKIIQPIDVRKFNPDLIVIHAAREDYSFIANQKNLTTHNKKTWKNMCENIGISIDYKSYTLFMVPYTNNKINNFIAQIGRNLRSDKGIALRKNINNKKVPRYDAYFIKNDFKYFDDVKVLLKKHNAIDYGYYIETI
jgi:hypothetical protein